ncbi:penicillin-binding protein 2 [Orientia chuto str. Dubai]|uniref:Penicillin-binding protein 2 n=1 Tax=Orientia chuto str. Dubai TaxID=1359168 RepID=A0A0F3MPA5_9RICK|nr:penicillin-binding protein 2 [Candidatus Orientia mediorientalis]KJV56444.1 penicillin-binding protein 2 [Orientia chuto str. Dubai]
MILNNKTHYNKLINRRTFLLLIGKLWLLCMLVGRLFYLQILQSGKYKILSDRNRINIIVLVAKRGKILDCHGNILAFNEQVFQIRANKKILAQNQYTTLNLLYDILNFSQEKREQINKKTLTNINEILILDNISWNELAIVEENSLNLPGIYIDIIEYRAYSYPLSTSHILGYTAWANDAEKANLNIERTRIQIGKRGLEKHFEDDLNGTCGFKKIEVDARGLKVRDLETTESIPGKDIVLSIDIRLQNKLYEMFNNNIGAAILTDVNTGKIKALVSVPGYNINAFPRRISTKDWQALLDDPNLPLVSRASQSLYHPGSIFQLVTVLAALDAGINPKLIICCNGKSFANNANFGCWDGHGNIDMLNAIKYSCNNYIYHLAKMIDYNNILAMARKLGFWRKTVVNFSNELIGNIPTPEWKKQKIKQRWILGDTLNIAIGQGYITTTPLQLARMITSLANGKQLLQLSLTVDEHGYHKNLNINASHIDFIYQALKAASINEIGETDHSLHKLIILGKAGSAQVGSSWQRQQSHGLFVGFSTTFDCPKYAVAVVLEHAGQTGIKSATTIAKNILTEASTSSTIFNSVQE